MMKKIRAIILLTVILTLTACGNEEVKENAEAEILEEIEEEVIEISESDFSFAEFKNLNFTFLSGAGGWSTELIIAEDGTFTGTYHDSEMGSATEKYPNGTYYYCSFSGKLSKPVYEEEYIYTTSIESITYDNPVGVEEIKDGIRYIYSDAYGLNNAQEIVIYCPGMPIEDLPEGYLSWVAGNWRMDYEFTMNHTTLPFYGLYNMSEEQGFSSYDIVEDLKQSLLYREESAAALEEAIMNDPNLTQMDMNEKTQQMYEIWDVTLNEIWGILKRNLSSTEMKALTEEQLDWIAMKEASMKEAGAEVEGGSMYGMVVNLKGAELTKERVYDLWEVLEENVGNGN